MVEQMDDVYPPLPPSERKGMFTKQSLPPPPDAGSSGINEIASRLRVAEERFSELRKKLLFIEQNMLANQKKVVSEVKAINSEVTELRHKIVQIEDRIITIVKEIKLTAKKEDFDVMRKYLDLWNPLKFTTENHVIKLIKEYLSSRESEEAPKEAKK